MTYSEYLKQHIGKNCKIEWYQNLTWLSIEDSGAQKIEDVYDDCIIVVRSTGSREVYHLSQITIIL